MAWRWLVLGEVLVVVLSMLSVSTGGGRHEFDAMIEPLLVTTLVQYVLLAFVFCREDMWVYISHADCVNPVGVVLVDRSLSLSAGSRLLLSVARGGEDVSADAELPDAVVHIRRREEAENRGCLFSPCLSLCFRCVCATVYRAPRRCVEQFGLICLNRTL